LVADDQSTFVGPFVGAYRLDAGKAPERMSSSAHHELASDCIV
jgi:hypothetical protein